MSSEFRAAESFDEKLLLDQIFGSSTEFSEAHPNIVPPLPVPPVTNQAWVADTSRNKNSLQWLREQEVLEPKRAWYGELFKEALLSKESRYWLAFILIAALVLTINNSVVGKQNNALKRHNWLTIQKGSLPLVPETTGVIRVDYQQ